LTFYFDYKVSELEMVSYGIFDGEQEYPNENCSSSKKHVEFLVLASGTMIIHEEMDTNSAMHTTTKVVLKLSTTILPIFWIPF
jgi:hypothetical protein